MQDMKRTPVYKKHSRKPNYAGGFLIAFLVMFITVYVVVYFADFIDSF